MTDNKNKKEPGSLSGEWRLITDADAVLDCLTAEARLDQCGMSQSVPSVWNMHPELFNYDGVCWYSREFYAEAGAVRFSFGGVCNDAEIYLDGMQVFSHEGAYLPFSFVTEIPKKGNHRFTIRLSNSVNNEDTLPARRRDWKRYGGIIRDVTLQLIPRDHIEKMSLTYELSDDLSSAQVATRVKFSGEKPAKYTLLEDGRAIGEYTLSLGDNLIEFTVDDVRLWGVGAPELYTFTLIGEVDSASVRTGFRRIGTRDGRITVNGEPVVILGVNRHEERYNRGHALTREDMLEDLALIEELGANTVRGSHYPNSDEFLDMCDERGILFWSELPMWQYGAAQAASPILRERLLRAGREMVEEYRHHPSIFCWGLHNECATETETLLSLSRELAELYRSLDQSRLITYATDRPLTDVCYPLCDFISVNRYPGWYGEDVGEWDSVLDELEKYAATQDSGDKPIIISEFGAGAIYGEHSPYLTKWSEEYQSLVLERSIEIFNRRGLGGFLVWQFADVRVSTEDALTRPRSFNNKGLLSERRERKLGFYAVKSGIKGYR